MKTHWYHRVQTWVLLVLLTSSILVFGLASFLIRESQVDSRVSSRVNDISRYAAAVASDISMSRYLNQASSGEYDAVDSMAGFYQEARILVLNEKCRVQKDSANTRRNRTVVNDAILTALSGVAVTNIEGMYCRIAVPVRNYTSTAVEGVVYVSMSLEKQYARERSGMEIIVYICALCWIPLAAVIGVAIGVGFAPLVKIRRWLKKVLNGHAVNPPMVRSRSEYGAIVESMNSVIADLKEADNSRKEFVSNVSHELKTPMSAIKVLTESLLLQQGAPEEMYREFLQDINSEIDRESALINDLLSLVRLEDNKGGLNLQMVSMNDLAETILKRLQPLADRNEVELVLESREQVNAEIDDMKMSVALSNLIENGIKYNKAGGSVRVKVDADFADAIITISDTGCGIPEEHFNKIYQRFYRVDKARDRAAGGTGLGLAIVHQIITMHHGSISIRSKVDVGTSFTVRIPLIAVKDALTLQQKEDES